MAATVSTAQATTLTTGQQGSGARIMAAPGDCPRGYFCGYAGYNYTNLAFKFQDCYMQPIAARTGGSWYNNQSDGTVARMYNANKQLVYKTPGAPFGDTHGDWTGIRYIDAC
ncbi:hypothetical protein [Streptomyces sp. NPDC006307]|uniref:hypothetical protein n=1 Tax=Streptomyces sp. NPDC006307 TaxID=3156748 RepID=UPI0033B4018E